jgi:Flp pilus assembly protein TadD
MLRILLHGSQPRREKQCSAILCQLAEADPKNAQTQRDLSISFERLGDVAAAPAAARRFYEQELEIRRNLAEADPENAEAQRALADSYARLGAVNRADKNLPEARRFF